MRICFSLCRLFVAFSVFLCFFVAGSRESCPSNYVPFSCGIFSVCLPFFISAVQFSQLAVDTEVIHRKVQGAGWFQVPNTAVCVMYSSDRLRDGTCCTVFTSSVPWLVPTPKTWRASIFIGHNRLLSPKSHSHTLLLRLSPLCCLVCLFSLFVVDLAGRAMMAWLSLVSSLENRSSRALYDKRISQEVEGEALGDEFAGYVSAARVLLVCVCRPGKVLSAIYCSS